MCGKSQITKINAGKSGGPKQASQINKSLFSKQLPLLSGSVLVAALGCVGCNSDKTSVGEGLVDSGLTIQQSQFCNDETFSGYKWQFLMGNGGRALIGPEGHWMQGNVINHNNGEIQITFANIEGAGVMTDGHVLAEGQEMIYAFDKNNTDIIVTFGGITQTISFCGFDDYDGERFALLQTDYPEGFLRCDYVDGFLNHTFHLEVNTEGMQQSIVLTTKKQGFVPDKSYENIDPACSDSEKLGGISEIFESEETSFSDTLTSANLPSNLLSHVRILGSKNYLVLSVEEDAITFVKELASATLSSDGILTAKEQGKDVFKVKYLGLDWKEKPMFAYEYESGEGFVLEEDVQNEPNLRRVSIIDSGNNLLDQFMVRFSDSGGSTVPVSIYRESDSMEMSNGTVLELEDNTSLGKGDRKTYLVETTSTPSGAIKGWKLTLSKD